VPAEVVRRLAHDDDIAVAGPVLGQSRQLAETDLVTIARTQSEAHLLAIAGRARIAEAVTDVLVRRGAREVAHRVADNLGARLSERSFCALVERSKSDSVLAERVGLRPDIPARLFRDLLLEATALVQQRLLTSATPAMQAEIRRLLAKVLRPTDATTAPPDYANAQRTIEALREGGMLSEASVVEFANEGQYADRGGGSVDGRGAARSGPNSLQNGQLVLGYRGGPHRSAAGRSGHIGLGSRCRPR
jgi:uncharacterized protein (DUF2336 family)